MIQSGIAVRTPHGASVAELRAALAANRARPQLDKELYDDDGYPILTARLADAGDAALRAELEQWRSAQALDDPRFDLAQWRALAAATAVLAELAALAASHQQLAPWWQQEQERQQHRLPPDAAPLPPPPALQLLTVWPPEWQAPQRHLAERWLRAVATEAGWPSERLASAAPEAAQPADAAQVLAGLLARCADARQPCLAIVIAAGSHLSDTGIGRLANDNALFTAHQPQGRIPGEGAAGLLLADAAQAALLAGRDQGGSLLQALDSGQRSSGADSAQRDTDTSLSSAASAVLQAAQVDGGAITAVTADTGHRTSRVTELMRMLTAVTPQLDPGADLASIGASCGSCGDATWLTALAVADAEAQDRGGPVLCISNEDPYRRCAALLRPALPA
ncbi:hypothetical protein GTP45_26925 [Pseudoduganella sp. FT55W]|uniref:Uncharacterized protein n=2 Tax=Duganella rivi TaxID=2666083 RepID=A0A7X4GVN7_9BURK|nr:hypothetical protein [Duganella rivi]